MEGMLLLVMGDKRLRGRWRSDRERTMADWRFPADPSPEKKDFVSGLWGKLELRYTRWRCESLFEGHTERMWYEVLAKDETSAMIRNWHRMPYLGLTRSLFHVHFEGDAYWITLGTSNNREFFRRID
jgi:hypothetical protein